MVIALMVAIPSVYKGYTQTGTLTLQNATNGVWTALYEGKFADILLPRQPSLSFWGTLELAAFKEGRKGVLIGNDGWLFTDEEFIADKNRATITKDNQNYILEAAAELKKNNINLLIALIPAKARMMKSKLGEISYPKYNHSFYQDMIEFLRAKEIHAPHIYSALSFKQNTFYKTDTHWTPYGARLSATSIADYLIQNKIFIGSDEYAYGAAKDEKFEGDLVSYIPAGDLKKKYGITKETASIKSVSMTNANETDTEASLFGDEVIPVTLIGTSYSANPRWNFENHLKYALKTDVLNKADEGLGPFATMRTYLSEGDYKNNPPELIIWEIPERYISLPESPPKDK